MNIYFDCLNFDCILHIFSYLNVDDSDSFNNVITHLIKTVDDSKMVTKHMINCNKAMLYSIKKLTQLCPECVSQNKRYVYKCWDCDVKLCHHNAYNITQSVIGITGNTFDQTLNYCLTCFSKEARICQLCKTYNKDHVRGYECLGCDVTICADCAHCRCGKCENAICKFCIDVPTGKEVHLETLKLSVWGIPTKNKPSTKKNRFLFKITNDFVKLSTYQCADCIKKETDIIAHLKINFEKTMVYKYSSVLSK